jgi:ubiquinone/menaquinone biosynthesis C-methylase UbiE
MLEVGTGPGRLIDFLRGPAQIKSKITAADMTSEMLAEVKENHPDIETIEANVMDLHNIPDNSYDWVVCSDVLIHIPEPYKALEELWRITKGALLFVVRATDEDYIVDIERSYQEVDGENYFFNVFNHEKMLNRIAGLSPKPVKTNSLLIDQTYAKNDLKRFIDVKKSSRFYTSNYVILKNPENINWIANKDYGFNEKAFTYRLGRKIRNTLGMSNIWDKGQ